MSQVILTNWTIWFADDAPAASVGYKQIQWTGGGGPETNTNTVNELYSEIMHYFSLPGNNAYDDTTVMRAVTPTVYEIGLFDQGDLEPWFIDPDSVEHLTGGSIQSVNWTRVTGTGTNAGIVKVAYTPTTNEFIDSDIGRTVTHDDLDTGTLVWFDATAGEAWIRPTDSLAANDWDSTSNDFVATGGTGDVTQTAAAVTGERLWSNIVTIGTIESNTRIYVAQDNTVLSNFWGNGDATTNQIDRLFLVNDGFDAGLIGDGLLTVYARQFSKLYDNFITDVSGGGQTSVPLSTGDDLNNLNGVRNVTVTGSSSAFSVEEIVTGGSSGAEAVVRANTGSPTTSFQYYLIGDLTDFNASEAISGSIVGANGSTDGAPTNVNASTYTDVVFEFGQFDDTFLTSQGFGSEILTTIGTHPFETEDIVNYSQEGGSENVGLTEGTLYYVNDLGATTLSLHLTAADALADTARVNLTTSGAETHLLARTFDVNEDDTDESFSVIIDAGTRPLDELYERMKFVNRRGETSEILNGIEGQQYIGIDFRVDYTALTGAIVAGNTLTQALASGDTLTTTVVHHNTIDGFLMLRDTINDPFDTGGGAANLEIDGSNFVTMTGSPTTEAITPTKVSPFGTFAGGRFFGTRGVFIENFDSLDTNNYQLIDDGGTTREAPLQVTFQLTGLETDSEVRLCDSDVADGAPGQELAGTESSGATFSFQYIYVGDTNAHVIIHHLDFVWQRINGLILSTSDQSIPIQQQPDRNYSNP